MSNNRLDFVDNMRLGVIALVVVVHAAVTYSGLGSWYIIEPRASARAAFAFFVTFQTFLQAFFMGALFFLAGYFAALSLMKKGRAAFVTGRLTRLGLPTLVYMLTIHPLTVYFLKDFDHTLYPVSFGQFYASYILSLHFLSGTGPMWFALALLIFCLIYAFVPGSEAARASDPKSGHTPPRFVLLAVLLALGAAAGAFLIRLPFPIGTSVLNMQLCFFSQYVILFVCGIEFYRRGWLFAMPYAAGRLLVILALAGIGVQIALFHAFGVYDHNITGILGGPTWQSLAYCLWESFTGVFVSLGLPVVLREKWNFRVGLIGRLPDLGFAVYMFHPPVLVYLTQVIRPMDSGALLKFMTLVAFALPLSFLAGWLAKTIPGVRELVKA